MRTLKLPFVVLLMLICVAAMAQETYQFQNRWKSTEFIHVEQPQPASGTIAPGWLSAQWIVEPVAETGYYQIRNVWRNQYLHIQNGTLECGDIQPGWWSAQWALEPVAGTTHVRIRNRWKPEVAIHNQSGLLEAGPIDLGWWSAQWAMININGSQPAAPIVAARNGGNPGAFTPEHNGTITQVIVRYTDQISMSDPAIGARVYFFPQEVITDTEGISFDPKNPPICGQVFKIVETSPEIKFDRPMPMMRNRYNESFQFVVEIF
jgi:hypothetical protein